MFVVVYYEEYVGCHFDEYSKYFTDKNKARKYKDKLNQELAKASLLNVEDLGDYYIVEEITKE